LKQKFKRYFLYFLLSFIALFILRLIFGYIVYSDDALINESHTVFQTNNQVGFELARKNYASEKSYDKGAKQSLPQGGIKFDQKYEKIGALSSTTNDFDNEEKNTRDLIKKFKALIQYEESSGLEGKRHLNLGIGVNPDKFDEMISEIKKIGKLQSIQVNKTDKTNEYSDLNAQKESLLKSREALISFKGKGGKIDELINLENKILEVEESIQKLGVKLGEFDTENEFCTIKFSLTETGKPNKSFFVSFVKRVKTAFEWTVKYYLLLIALFTFAALGILIGLAILEKLKIFPDLLKKYLESDEK